jgi:formamidopyrimidine-DNA glycosylase
MPELPEVEVTRLSFADRIAGARIEQVRMGKPLRWPLGCAPMDLVGRQVRAVRRRGKYLLLDLDQGLLLMHLGMSGSLSFAPSQPPPGTHDHFDLVTTRGVLRLNDPRRFGAVVHVEEEQAPGAIKLLGSLGVEPLDEGFDAAAFHAGLRRRKEPVKQVLLAGDVVVGVGNIYASEALFLAGIRPTLSAARISRPRALKLHAAIREVLARAVKQGGSTLRDFSNAQGESGYFQLEAMVYGRAGQPCRVCGTRSSRSARGKERLFTVLRVRRHESRLPRPAADASLHEPRCYSQLDRGLGWALPSTSSLINTAPGAASSPCASSSCRSGSATTSCSTPPSRNACAASKRRCAPTR